MVGDPRGRQSTAGSPNVMADSQVGTDGEVLVVAVSSLRKCTARLE